MLLTTHQLVFYLHVVCGSCALLLFWVPVFARKGSVDHKRFGRYFAYIMYTVSISGLIMSSIDLIWPLSAHQLPEDRTFSAAETASIVNSIRGAAMFLFSLSVLVLVTTRHGWLVVRNKADRMPVRSKSHLTLCGSLVAVGVVLFTLGVIYQRTLYLVFGPLEIWLGINILRYCLQAEVEPRAWWFEHFGALIATGIGAYTAFFVFGGRQILDEIFIGGFGGLTVVLWVAPAASSAVVLLLRGDGPIRA